MIAFQSALKVLELQLKCHLLPVASIDYRCADKKKLGELRGDIGAIRYGKS